MTDNRLSATTGFPANADAIAGEGGNYRVDKRRNAGTIRVPL